LEARFNFVVAAVLTALPFAGVHVPLLLLDDQVSALSVLIGIAGLLILGIVSMRLSGEAWDGWDWQASWLHFPAPI
jgi:membrane protease YdiL (CAAX protease family)